MTMLQLFGGDSEAEKHARAVNWCATGMGLPTGWPAELRIAAEQVCSSKLPMFVAWGPKLEVIYNDPFIELLGAKHPWAMGQPHLDVWAEAKEGLEPLVKRALEGESLLIKDVSFDIKRGEAVQQVQVTFSYNPLRTANGEVAGIQCVCVETTEVARLLHLQTEQRARLETLFRQSAGFMAVVRGPNHVFDLVNDEYLQLVGFRDLVGKSVASALPEVVEQGFIELLDRVRTTGEPYVGKDMPITLQKVKDGPPTLAFVDFVYQPLRGVMGEVDGILAQGHDVTDQRAAREELQAFANSIPAIAWVAKPDGSLEHFNKQWQAYTGAPEEVALGRGWVEYVHPDDLPAAREVWHAARDGTVPWHIEYRLRSADGSYRWFLARAVPQLNAVGRVVKWFGTTTDIEDSRRAAQTLESASRQKDEFLATLAHELRNPLAPIRFATETLSSSKATPEARAKSVDVIRRQVDQMSHLLEDLIDVARVTERRLVLRKEAVSVRQPLDAAIEAARPLIERKRHDLTVSIEEPIPVVMADPVRLAQVMTNLLTNAAKYTDPGGRIRIEAAAAKGRCVLRVVDNGVGLAPGSSDSIFELFTQAQSALERSEGGLGIGLALVKGVVELHGGTVSAASEGLGKGSAFEVVLPLATCTAKEPKPLEEVAPKAAAKVILLADDNADAVESMAELLKMAGHLVHIAYDGAEAVAKASEVSPQVAILDIGMPKMNGYEAARLIRSGHPDCLLIAATGWGQENDRRRAFDAGFDAHLTKPMEPSAIFKLIGQGREVAAFDKK
jgi:PAS domain S-box-containing protein